MASASALLPEVPTGGFTFDNVQRNEMLVQKGYPMPKAQKTGTTIVGLIFKDGVILGADTRATNGDIVADKNCEKLHRLMDHIYCAGAGTAADCDHVTRMISSQLYLHQINSGKTVPVIVAIRLLKQYLFRYQGHVSAALIVGGFDSAGPKLVQIYPHGSGDSLPFTTMGSGSLAAMAVLETGYKPGLEREPAKKLVRDAVAAGVFNDLGSGSNIDLCIITKEGREYLRPYDVANVKPETTPIRYQKGSTAVLSTKVIPLIVEDEMVRNVDPVRDSEAMDTA